MELGAFAAALVRRWYLVAVALGLAAGACVLMVSSVGPSYETSASVLLFPPASDGTPDEQTSSNPYLELNGLNSARDILIRSLTSQSARDALDDTHPDADYALEPDATSAGPVIVLSVSAPSKEQAIGAQATLLAQVPVALADLQHGLGLSQPESITAREITADQRAEVVRKSQVRAGIVAAVGVMAIALAVIGLVDGLLTSRSAARDRELAPDEPAAAQEKTSHDESLEGVTVRAVPRNRDLGQESARTRTRRATRFDDARTARDDPREMDRAGA